MISHDYSITFDTPVARMGARLAGDAVTGISWLPDTVPLLDTGNKKAKKLKSTILDYLGEGRPLSRIPLQLTGTPFQLKVWSALQKIKMGSVITYGELAAELATSSRAIGQACRTNPVVLFVPCHRVVSASGLGGYMGKQNKINIKSWLLEHEKACS